MEQLSTSLVVKRTARSPRWNSIRTRTFTAFDRLRSLKLVGDDDATRLLLHFYGPQLREVKPVLDIAYSYASFDASYGVAIRGTCAVMLSPLISFERMSHVNCS